MGGGGAVGRVGWGGGPGGAIWGGGLGGRGGGASLLSILDLNTHSNPSLG